MNKVVIVGCGNVGTSYAFSLINQNAYVNEIVLVDIIDTKVEGEVLDLTNALPYTNPNMKIKAGTYDDCKDADIVCITAGVPHRPGMTSRLEDLDKGCAILKSIVKPIAQSGFSGIYLIASNPLDVMSYLAFKESGISPERVIGSGTCLDTARLRCVLSEKLNVSPKSIDAYVMGEHGNSQFVAWNSAKFGGKNVIDYINDTDRDSIENYVKYLGLEIGEKKGYTCYGIGMTLARITKAILGNENAILSVSSYNKEHDIFIGSPSIINRNGVAESNLVDLSSEEQEKFNNSISIIKDAISKIS